MARTPEKELILVQAFRHVFPDAEICDCVHITNLEEQTVQKWWNAPLSDEQ